MSNQQRSYVFDGWLARGETFGMTHRMFGRQLWTKAIARKAFDCIWCGKTNPKGVKVYRACTNKGNRMDRICNCIETSH